MLDEDVRKEVQVAFEYCYLHEDWVNPLEEALAGVTVDQALWRPGPEGKGIWDIVLHTAVWNENIVERIETGEDVHPPEGAWPPLPSVPNEQAWEASKQRLKDSYALVQRMLQTTAWDKILKSPYGLADLLCRATHSGYHLGQITKLRECLETLDPNWSN